MTELSPYSPEARRKRLALMKARFGSAVMDRVRPGTRPFEVVKRVAVGAYNDGFIHAGNLAYLAILTLFPFFIFAAALTGLLGSAADGQRTVSSFLQQFPPEVAELLATPINDVLTARTGNLLWLGAIVGLWTATSLIETIRDILRRAYGVPFSKPFWEYRLWSIGLMLASVVLMMLSFALSVVLSSIQHLLVMYLPIAEGAVTTLDVYRLAPAVFLFGTFYALFYALTPGRYRKKGYRVWPGALLVTTWWLGTTELLPHAIGMLGGYALTYGSLAGIMVALIYFFMIGMGVVLGAELNAALADTDGTALKGEVYAGPFKNELEVEEPEPGEDIDLDAPQSVALPNL